VASSTIILQYIKNKEKRRRGEEEKRRRGEEEKKRRGEEEKRRRGIL
jgi:hypothetical protein